MLRWELSNYFCDKPTKVKPRTIVLILSILLIGFVSESKAEEDYKLRFYSLQKHQAAPVIDGVWDDEIWQSIPVTSNFTQTIPVENDPPSFKTEVKMYYDDNAIYIAAYCYDDEVDKILTQLGNRDNDLNADHFRIAIDPYDKQQDFNSFQVTASGVQSDFKRSDGNFNTVWKSAVKINEDGWSLEIKIPYSALRFPKLDVQQWGIQMYRNIRRLREEVVWSPIDRSANNYVDYFGKLTDIEGIDPPLRLSLTPFINVELKSSPDENNNRAFDWLITGGADLKYGINESFTLDMTLLPDFSQVQSDDNINNLSAFEQVFDEQRPFFQEGVDLFNKANLFYSRRIGSRVVNGSVVQDIVDNQGDSTITVLDNPDNSRLLNAFKISGRTKKSVGIGVFNAIEGRSFAELQYDYAGNEFTNEVQTDPLSNYNIFVLDKNFKNNKSIFGINTNVTRSDGYRNANVTALGFSANFKENKYNVRASTSYSVINEKIDSIERKTGYQYVFDFDKISGNFRWGWRTEAVSEDYDKNDLGRIFETDFYQHGFSMNYNVYEPIARLRDLYTHFFINVRQHRPTGELSSMNFNLGLNTTFDKKYLRYWAGINAALYEEKNYYEARTDGQVYRGPRFFNAYTGISTDFRRKLALESEIYFRVTGMNGGATDFGLWMHPILRVNDHLTLEYDFNYDKSINDVGFATRDNQSNPIFGKRNITDIQNVLSGNYIFKNDLSLGLRARHYWSRVTYNSYHGLNQEGYLIATTYTSDDENDGNNINFNAFNIDLLFNWQFAPGSALSITYKNSIFSYGSKVEGNLFNNLGRLFDETQTNVVSVKLIYYLDYVTVRSWRDKRKSRV